jgi:hypothetical protein
MNRTEAALGPGGGSRFILFFAIRRVEFLSVELAIKCGYGVNEASTGLRAVVLPPSLKILLNSRTPSGHALQGDHSAQL